MKENKLSLATNRGNNKHLQTLILLQDFNGHVTELEWL